MSMQASSFLALAGPAEFWRQLDNPVAFLVLGSLAAMVMGAAKSGFAGGIGLLSMPILIYACAGNSTLANAMMLPLLIACDYVTIVIWWRRWDARVVLLLVPGMIVGIALGTLALWGMLSLGGGLRGPQQKLTDAALNLTIGLLALGFVGLRIWRTFHKATTPFRPNSVNGFATGTAAGLTSTLAHAAGPITTMFLLPQAMDKTKFVATACLYYFIGNQLKLAPYLGLRLLTVESMMGSLFLLPAVVVGAFLGAFLHKRVNEKIFSAIVYVLLTAAGVQLIRDALRTLLG